MTGGTELAPSRHDDFIELNEDVSASRTWSTYHIAALWLVQVAIIVRGLEGIGALLWWWAIVKGGGLMHIRSESPKLQRGSTPFWALCPATLSLNTPDFTRYAKSQRSRALG